MTAMMNPLQHLKPVFAPTNTTTSAAVSARPQNGQPLLNDAPAALSKRADTSTSFDASAATVSMHVDISALGRKKLAEANKDQDIENSDMPAHVKQTLKMIRRHQEQLREKQQQLVKLQQDNRLQGDEKEEKLKSLQSEVADLQRMINGMKSELIKSAEKQNFSETQMQTLTTLMG
jgi:chromosome segregation ATPase